jgi:hypothetical protein
MKIFTTKARKNENTKKKIKKIDNFVLSKFRVFVVKIHYCIYSIFRITIESVGALFA